MSSNEELALCIKQGKNLKNELFEKIYKLIYFFCKKYIPYAEQLGYETDDLISVAWFGVENAIKDYIPDKGYKFTSYLKYHVKKEIYEFFGWRGAAGKIKRPIYLDAPLKNQDGDKITLADTIPDIGAEEDFDKAEYHDYYSVLMRELDRLTPEQTEIIKRHYLENETITHIAQTKDVSIENVASKKRKALRSLRQSAKLKECYYTDVAYRHVGISSFNTTWTSSTEWAAMKVMKEKNLSKLDIEN